VALDKYALAVGQDSDNPHLWINIGVCLFSKQARTETQLASAGLCRLAGMVHACTLRGAAASARCFQPTLPGAACWTWAWQLRQHRHAQHVLIPFPPCAPSCPLTRWRLLLLNAAALCCGRCVPQARPAPGALRVAGQLQPRAGAPAHRAARQRFPAPQLRHPAAA
jgi:hypothetical protein